MNVTKVKDKMHYCPSCGSPANKTLAVTEVDITKKAVGMRFGYPYYGVTIECTKCKWTGEWFIPKKDLVMLEKKYRQAVNPSRLMKV